MKFFLILSLLILGGCCRNYYYDPVEYASPSFKLNLDYHYKGLSASDTMFEVRSFFYGGYSDYNIFYGQDLLDSQRSISLYNILNTEKIIIESTVSSFSDTLYNMGYNRREVKVGNRRCGYSQYQYFNVHATYKGQNLSSGENSMLEINLRK